MRVGVVGLGYWGSKVVEEYAALRDDGVIDAVAGCDVDRERVAATDDVDAGYTDVDGLLPEVDAIHVCTSNETHAPVATAALDAGVDALVEKPLASTRADAYDLAELASETGRVLQTGHIYRFANVVRELRDLYRDEYFGDVRQINVQWTHHVDPRTEDGVLWDLLTHPIDILNFVTGEWPSDATGETYSFRHEDVAEAASLQLSGEIPPTTVGLSWVDPVRRRTFQVVGSRRTVVAECVEQTISVYEDGEQSERQVTANNTIRTEAENFIEAIETGENTFNSAVVGARAVDAIQSIEKQTAD